MSEPVDLIEITEEIKSLLLKRIKDETIETKDLVSLMPWVSPKCVDESKVKYEITHKFEVVKPQLTNSQQTPVLITSVENVEGELEHVDLCTKREDKE